jgi:hypothetical protein
MCAEPHLEVRGEIAWDAPLPKEGVIGLEGKPKVEWPVTEIL